MIAPTAASSAARVRGFAITWATPKDQAVVPAVQRPERNSAEMAMFRHEKTDDHEICSTAIERGVRSAVADAVAGVRQPFLEQAAHQIIFLVDGNVHGWSVRGAACERISCRWGQISTEMIVVYGWLRLNGFSRNDRRRALKCAAHAAALTS
jgi:hypothetical protein